MKYIIAKQTIENVTCHVNLTLTSKRHLKTALELINIVPHLYIYINNGYLGLLKIVFSQHKLFGGL